LPHNDSSILDAGDIESMPFIEALGQFSYRVGKKTTVLPEHDKFLFIIVILQFPFSLNWYACSCSVLQDLETSVWFMSVSFQF
jgi:hypothetical protein